MRILHVISQHPGRTGSGYYLQQIIRHAAQAGFQNRLVAGVSTDDQPSLDGLPAKACHYVRFPARDLDFIIPGMSDVMPYPSSRFRDMSPEMTDQYYQAFTNTLQAAAAQGPLDIIHSHHLWLVSSLTRQLFPSVPLVTSCHSTDLRQFQQCPVLRDRVLHGCRFIDGVLALNENQATTIVDLFGIERERIAVVGSGFDEREFRPGEKSVAPPVHFVYAGKLSFAKGVDWLLRVFGNLSGPDVHLHLVGSGFGNEADACLRHAGRLGARIVVHGALRQADLARLMRRCHIFVLPSFYEGLPLVLLEALATGCRVVTTDLPGCREILDKAGDDLVELVTLPQLATIDRPNKSDWPLLDQRLGLALQRMINRVLDNPIPCWGRIADIVNKYSWQHVFGRIADQYDRVRSVRKRT